MKSGLGNLTVRNLDQLAGTVRNRVRRIQRQPDLITAFLGQTGLTLQSELAWLQTPPFRSPVANGHSGG